MGTTDSFDVDAREAELRRPERISPMTPEEFSAEHLETVVNVRKAMGVAQSGDVSPYFRIALKHPGLFAVHMEYGIQVAGRGLISRRDMELAVMRVAWKTRSPYEWGEHVRISQSMGLLPEEIERASQGPSAEGWNDHDRAIVQAVDELLDDTYITDATWAKLASFWDEAQLLEFPIIVGFYVMTAMQQNAIRLRLHDDNPGLHRR